MNIRFVDLPRQNKIIKKQLIKTIESIIDKADFIQGEELDAFEKNFAKFCNVKYAVGLNSGTDALKLALIAYGIKEGDEVITVPNGYFSAASVISEIGAKPVFVDIDPDTYTLNTSLLEKKITKKTKAIIPVHLYGQVSDMDPILTLAKKYKLVVVEDACQAHGAKYKGKIIPIGETAAFSFYPGKNLGSFGDGGILVTNNPTIAYKMKYLRNDGAIQKYIHNFFGIKSRLDTIQAAILNVKLPMLDSFNEKRRKHARLYSKLLSKIEQIKIPVERKNTEHVYHIYAIETEKRDKLRLFLQERGIETNIHYPIPIHLQEPYLKQGFKKGDFPVTEEKALKILSLPMFPEMTDDEIHYACRMISFFFEV